jgi:hypothetical protein
LDEESLEEPVVIDDWEKKAEKPKGGEELDLKEKRNIL